MLKCNIVKDLLPSYIDGLTSEESNQEISEHIENCTDCNNVYVKMQEPVSIDKPAENNKIDFLKKVKQKSTRRITIIISIIILLTIVYIVMAFVEFPVDSGGITIQSSLNSVSLGGGTLPDGALGWWRVEYTLSSNMVLGSRVGGNEIKTDSNGNVISNTEIIIPRQTLPLLINPGENRNSIEMAIYEDIEYIIILRFSDQDIIVKPDNLLE